MSETDSSTVITMLGPEPGVLGNEMEGNKEVEASGHIIGSEDFQIGWHENTFLALIFNWMTAD